MPSLSRDSWMTQREADLARVRPIAAERVNRHGQKHPVYDFLFEYYSFRAAHVLRWSAGAGIFLADTSPEETDWPSWYTAHAGGCWIDPASFPEKRKPYLSWATEALEKIEAREPHFGCFGLHEWAMVYRTTDVRHNRVPLRLSVEETNSVVEQHRLCCTHYDAFRFFTPEAVPRNRTQLRKEDVAGFDQPGCIHANMDLYKFAYKLAPFTPTWLLADALEVAVAARELDMRASPYDLSALGFMPIRIETKAGREEYVEGQRKMMEMAQPVRRMMLELYRAVCLGEPAT